MKKIVFTLVALAGLLSASEYVNIQNNIVTMSENRNIIGVAFANYLLANNQ